jgi:hypothetical protein
MLTSGLYGYLADYVLWVVLFASLVVHTWCFFKFGKKSGRLRLILGNVLLTLCMLGTVALIAESYFRFISVGTDPFGVTMASRRWFVYYTDLNSLGCRDKEWTREKPPDIYRMAVVGDSFVYGWGIREPGDRFPDLLQHRFDQLAPGRVEVMNVAKPGLDSAEELLPIQQMVEVYGVDEVLLGYVPNDIEKVIPQEDGVDRTEPPFCQWFNTDSSALAEFLYYRLVVPRKDTVQSYGDWLMAAYTDATLWRRQQEELGKIISYCRDKNVSLKVALLPLLRAGGASDGSAAGGGPSDAQTGEHGSGGGYDPRQVHGQVAYFFERNGVPVVDLRPAIAGVDPTTLVVSAWDAHPNEAAHALFADAIWQAFYAPQAQVPSSGTKTTVPTTPGPE